MGAVPVAAMLKVADCPAVIFTLAGCVEIVGATGEFGGVWPLPVPLSKTEIAEPSALSNSRLPK
jgi:hypothetical protein